MMWAHIKDKEHTVTENTESISSLFHKNQLDPCLKITDKIKWLRASLWASLPPLSTHCPAAQKALFL